MNQIVSTKNRQARYTEALLHLTSKKEERFHGDVARRFMAKACDDMEIDPELFARNTDSTLLQGQTPEGYGVAPAVTWGGGKGYIRLTGYGVKGERLINDNIGRLFQAAGKICTTEIRLSQGEVGLRLTQEPRFYRLARVVVQRHCKSISKDKRETFEYCRPLFARAVMSGLISQGHHLMQLDVPDESRLDITLFEGNPFFLKFHPDRNVSVLAMDNVAFAMNAALSGPWHMGMLRSYGYGRAYPLHRNEPEA